MMQARAVFACMTGRLALLALLLPGMAWGLASDRDQPINIAADSATLDEKAGTGIYEGNVYLHQGTLQLHGSKMTVRLNNNRIELITIEGQPASFSQRPDGADTDQQAEAGHIEYHARDQQLILLDKAVIRQQDREQFSSDRIELNLRDNTVKAGGSNGDGRVHIILQPNRELIEQQDNDLIEQPDNTAE
jgi:lipopolysaccharide export system protein LptA